MTHTRSLRRFTSAVAALALAYGVLTLASPPVQAAPAALTIAVDATETNIHTVVLTWLAPNDDTTASGRAQAYDVRYSTSPITTANFDAAAKADMTIAPQPAGDTERLYVDNLSNGKTYYFAEKTIDGNGTASDMSNVVSATTGPQPGAVASVTVNSIADLQTQIDNAPPQGVVITLAAGDYQQDQTVQLYGKNNITIQGATSNPADTVIRGQGMNGSILHNIYINASSYVTVKNLTLKDTYYHGIQIANGSQYFHADNLVLWDNGESAFKISAGEWGVEGTDQVSDYGLIENCHFGFTDYGARDVIEGIDGVAARGWVVKNNVAENIRDPNGSVAYAMYFKGNSIDSVFENNVVINSDVGISFGDGSTGYTYFRYGDTSFEHRGGIIANNVIESTSKDTGIVLRGATGFKVYNNTVWNTDAYYYNSISLRVSDVQVPAGYPAPQPTQNGEIINNIFRFAIEPDYGSTTQQLSSTIVEQNNLAGGQSVATGLDPSLFVDAANGDFHLATTATAAIGQGQNLIADVPTDADGNARPASGAFDIGAYQASAPSSQIHVANQSDLLAAVAAAKTSGQPTEIVLDTGIQTGQTIVIPAGATVTLTNPFQLEMTANASTIEVEQGASLTLDGPEVTASSGATGTGVVVDGNLVLASGAITGNTKTDDGVGGGVTVNAPGQFTMTGGDITGNTTADCGGGVYVGGSGASFTLSGGNITGNTAGQSGGGVCNTQGANFTMEDGIVSDNVAQQYYGGGVANTASASFSLLGGEISGNSTVLLGGGGVFNNTAATFNFSGGDIDNNVVGTGYVSGAAPNGGGVYNGSTGVMAMSGGNVFDNKSVSGGGVFNGGGTSLGVFTLSGGTITGNTASYPGGGVYNGGDFTMTDGDISGNTAAVQGGGVFNGANMTMSGGTITHNASPNGGGVVNTTDVTSLVIGGTASVTGNTYPTGEASNVILSPGVYITLGDGVNGAAMPSTMSVAVTKASDSGVIVLAGASASDTAYFTSDDPGLAVLFDLGQIRLGQPQAVSGVALDQATLGLTVGNSASLAATVQPADATNQTVTWASSDDAVATVDASGTVTAHSVGTATITVTTADGGFTDTAQVTVSAAPTCTGVDGALTSGDSLVPWSGNGGYDASHYDIDLTYNPAAGGNPATIDATTTINASVTGQPLCSFGLDLLGLTVSSVTVNGVAAGFDRIQDPATNMYKLVVTPSAPVTGDFTVAVTYGGQPQQFTFRGSSNFAVGWLPDQSFTVGGTTYPADGGAVGLGEPVGAFAWYPVNATPADKASYTTSLTVPNEFAGVAVGQLVSTTAVGSDMTRWTWDEPDAVPSSFTIAAIGTYQADTDTYTTTGGNVVPIDIYTDPVLGQAGQGTDHYMDLTKQLLDWGENYFGPYQPSVAGYIMKRIAVSYALEVYGKPFYTSDWGDQIYIHEFAHQWGGNSVSVGDWADLWLAEGFATYMPWLWNEDHGGQTVTDQAMAVYNLPETDPVWSVAPAAMTSQSDMFGNWDYDGGALALAALRQGIGPDLMQQVLYDWFTQNAGGNVSTQDFIDLAEQVSGADLTQWAHDYLYTTGKPPAWPAALSYLPPTTTMDAELQGFTVDTSSFGNSPVAYAVGDPGPTVQAEQSFYFSIKVKNTGSATWGYYTDQGQVPVSLLTTNPDFNTTFGTYFIADAHSTTVPGDQMTLTTGLRAPSTPGTYTMTWQLAQWMTGDPPPTAATPRFGPTITFTITVVARTDSPPPAPVKQPGVIDSSDFEYVGSFALPAVPNTVGGDEKTFFASGITLRTVNGQKRLLLTTGSYDQTLYEVAIPTPEKIVGNDISAVPTAQLTDVFGELPKGPAGPSGILPSTNGTMWYDQDSGLLYWTNYQFYTPVGVPTDYPVLQAASLDNGTVDVVGNWFQIDPMDAPQLSFVGGVTTIPSDFADQYTGGRTLGLGFGGSYSGLSSPGPALSAVGALGASGTTMDQQLVMYYSPTVVTGGMGQTLEGLAPRDGNYFLTGSSYQYAQPSSPWQGTWTRVDSVGSGVFIDLPDKQGYLTFSHQGTGRVAYDQGGTNWNGTYQNVWYFYSYDELGATATGAIPAYDAVPSSTWNIDLPDTDSSANQQITGSAFDPETRLLYVYSLMAAPAPVIGTMYSQPLVHVYYVKADLSSLSLTPPATTTYAIGDKLDLTGLAVTAQYADATTADVTTAATIDLADGTVLGTLGTQTVTVSYTEDGITKTASFDVTVNPRSLSSATVSVAGPVAYTGGALTPAVTVSLGGVSLVAGQDYTVAYSDNTDVGTATVTVTGIGNYAGSTATANFTITPRVIKFIVDPIPDQAYTGQAITPSVVVRDGAAPVPTQDYTVAYSDNTDVGTATVTVTGIGNYARSTGIAHFAITTTAPPVQSQTLTFDQTSVTKTLGDPAFTNPLTHVGGGALSFTSTNPAVATVDPTGLVTIVGAGSASITVVAAGVTGQWLETSASYSLTVAPPAPTLTVAPASWSAPAGASTTDATVTTNQTTWTAASDQPWLTAVRNGDSLKLAADPNPTASIRTATVTVEAGGLQASVTVTQAAATLTAGTTNWTLDSAGGAKSITVTSSSGLGWQVSGLPAWLTASASSGDASTPLVLTAAPYTGGPWSVRTATITVSVPGTDPAHPLQVQVVVSQHNWPGDAIMIAHDGAPVGEAQVGWTVTGVAAGFQPGESVQGSMQSTPLDLGTQVADANGLVQFTWVIPDGTALGAHAFVATGTTQTLQAAFTVIAGPVEPGGSGGSGGGSGGSGGGSGGSGGGSGGSGGSGSGTGSGTGGSGSNTGGNQTVETGGTIAPDLGIWAVLLLVSGVAALVVGWRRYRVS